MTVSCVRCGAPAGAVMAFQYGDRQIWLDDLAETGDLAGIYPMCESHANRMSPPVGWTLTDLRRPVRPLFVSREVA